MTSTPSTSIAPAVGRMRPISMRMVVLLPEPLAPRKAKIEPAATSIESASTAVKAPKRLVSARVLMIGPASRPLGERAQRRLHVERRLLGEADRAAGEGRQIGEQARGARGLPAAHLDARETPGRPRALDVRQRPRRPRDRPRVAPGAVDLEGPGRAQPGRRAGGDQAAALEVEQPVRRGRFVEVAGGEEDERGFPLAFEERPDLGARHHVDARRRLVEQEERRAREERAGNRELLLHAARERAGGPPREGGEPGARQQLAGARAVFRLRHAVEARREAQVLLHREIAVEAEGLRDVADARLERRHVAAQIVAEDGRLRGLDLEEPRQRAQERRLPGAVGPDDAHDLAPLEHEIDAGERAPGAVALLEGAQSDHGWRYTLPSVPGWRCSTFSSTRTLAR